MFRKSTLFFSTAVRKQMRDDLEFVRSNAFLSAMKLPQELIECALRGGYTATDEQQRRSPRWKLFGRGRHQNEELQVAAKNATRIESSIEFRTPGRLQVAVLFYKTGSTRSFFRVFLDLDDGGRVIRAASDYYDSSIAPS